MSAHTTEPQSSIEICSAHLLHVVPVGDDTVLDRVLQGEDTSLGLSLVTDIRVLLAARVALVEVMW